MRPLRILAFCACFSAFSLAAVCKDSVPGGAATEESRAEYAKRLSRKANSLALEELARMAAAELVYRNQSKLHTAMAPMQEDPIGVYVKMYRDFKTSSVVDIYWSDSILAPISFQIRYTYDLIGTTPRSISRPSSEAVSIKDSVFTMLGTYGLTRWYECDSDGNYMGNLPLLPDRPDYYNLGIHPAEKGAAVVNPRPRRAPGVRSVSRGPRSVIAP